MKAAPYCPATLVRIRAGATAGDLGWDAAMYLSVCRRHEISPAVAPVAASPEARAWRAPKLVPALAPVAEVVAVDRAPRDQSKYFTFVVSKGMHAAAQAVADVDGISVAQVARTALIETRQSKGALQDWRNGASAGRSITMFLSPADRREFAQAADVRDLTFPEFCRRALSVYLKSRDLGV